MYRKEIERGYRRGAISRVEHDERLLYTPEYCQLTIDIVDTDANIFQLFVTIHNKYDHPLYCSLTPNVYPGLKLRGLTITDEAGEELFIPAILTGVSIFPRATQETTVIPPQGHFVLEIRGNIRGDSVLFEGHIKMVYTPGKRYHVQYKYAGLISNTVSWVGPVT